MNKKRNKSWLERKLADPKFRKGFEEEYQRISIGEQLLRIRLEAGLSQRDLAKRVGTTASAISSYENDEYKRYELRPLQKIARTCKRRLRIVVEPDRNFKKAA